MEKMMKKIVHFLIIKTVLAILVDLLKMEL